MPSTALESLTGNDRTPWQLGRGSMPRLREIFPLIAIVSVVLVRGEIYFAIWLREEGLDVAHSSPSIRGVLLFALTFIVCNRAGSGSAIGMPRKYDLF